MPDAKRGRAHRGRVRIARRYRHARGVAGREEHGDALGGGLDQVVVLDPEQVDRDRLGSAFPGVRGDAGERVTAGTVEDQRVGVIQGLQAVVAVVARVAADHELVGHRRQVVGGFDVQLLLGVERVAARRPFAEGKLGIPPGRRRLDAVDRGVGPQGLEHVRGGAHLHQGDRDALAVAGGAEAVGQAKLLWRVAADDRREPRRAVLPGQAGRVVLEVPLRAGERRRFRLSPNGRCPLGGTAQGGSTLEGSTPWGRQVPCPGIRHRRRRVVQAGDPLDAAGDRRGQRDWAVVGAQPVPARVGVTACPVVGEPYLQRLVDRGHGRGGAHVVATGVGAGGGEALGRQPRLNRGRRLWRGGVLRRIRRRGQEVPEQRVARGGHGGGIALRRGPRSQPELEGQRVRRGDAPGRPAGGGERRDAVRQRRGARADVAAGTDGADGADGADLTNRNADGLGLRGRAGRGRADRAGRDRRAIAVAAMTTVAAMTLLAGDTEGRPTGR